MEKSKPKSITFEDLIETAEEEPVLDMDFDLEISEAVPVVKVNELSKSARVSSSKSSNRISFQPSAPRSNRLSMRED